MTCANEPSCQACGCPSRANGGRRSFLGTLATLAGALLLPRRAWAKKLALSLDKVPQLKTVGGFAIVRIKDRMILFIRDTPATVRAVDAVCTHKKNLLKYDPQLKLVRCPEHGSRYTLEGKVVKGPSTRPLSPVYAARLDLPANRILLEV
ncbi:MAG: Rieske (2Fe-2S) protein [Deltaproteobacteria bacterium]|nr:Rieske (2Fe-2S) protein [Deltaproteobacteria bacterium]